jgi:hypothetical protein
MVDSSNPAAQQGWVKSADPKSGRVFYANHITRKTQWDPPDGWKEEEIQSSPPVSSRMSSSLDEEEPLPSNWEKLHDPTTGKAFYVDHERKITTWTRPKVESTPNRQPQMSLKPAVASPPSSGNASAALARILQQQEYEQANSYQNYGSNRSDSNAASPSPYHQNSSLARSYQQEASYYTTTSSSDADYSDTLPALDFEVQKVADHLRPNCAHCDTVFSMSRRRHHCRLCGDVFCDPCSNHRATLPLQGSEFEKPVRVCDFCYTDVEAGQFFSFRRYLTPLHLYDPDHGQADEERSGGVATASNVNAALSALTSDLDQLLSNPSPEVITARLRGLPADLWIPELAKHLQHTSTADRTVRVVASLLALESIVGGEKAEYAVGVYWYGRTILLDGILSVLERSATDRKTLFVQEQAARVVFYLTDSQTVSSVTRASNESYSDSNDESSAGSMDDLDVHRALRNMLDHSSSKHVTLQRWAAASIKNLVLEDQRRTCLAVNDIAAAVASGETASELSYTSFLDELIASGGAMLLCSLIGANDTDARSHAVAALGAILTSTRAVDAALMTLSEMTGRGASRARDGDIVRAVVAGGGCGASVAQQLLSAENAVAGMCCHFLMSLVMPLLSDPLAGESLPFRYDYRNDQQGLGACREAAVEIATGSCLPPLLSLIRERGHVSRPIELRQVAMECLAAVATTIGSMGKAWAHDQYEEGLDNSGAPGKLKDAITMLNEEGSIDVALEVIQSSVAQSLGSSMKETPSSRIREAAGIVLGSLTSCSAEAILKLQSRQIISSLLISSNDATMTVPSSLRGDSPPRCLGVLETAASLLMFSWQHPSGASSELLDRLIEVIDAGAIPYLSKIINAKIDWDSKDKAAGGMKGRSAACRLLCCIFGICLTDMTGIGIRRVMDAVDTDSCSYRGSEKAPSNIIESTLGVLQTSSGYARKALMGSLTQGPHYQAALMDLVGTALLAIGSMCGSSVAPGGTDGSLITGERFLTARDDQYVARRSEICKVACDVVVRGARSGPALLPTMLVGGFGEMCVVASLRLALAIAQNGTKDQHAKLATSGILVPISDSLRAALSDGDLFKFSAALALVRFCGPHVAAGQGGGLESVRDAIRVATDVLTLPLNPDASYDQMERQESLKAECIAALESLSRNASLWSSISTEALPSIARYLDFSSTGPGNVKTQATRAAALRAILQIVQVPSHAVAAADAGIAEALGSIMKSHEYGSGEDEVPILALEVLHALTTNDQARIRTRFLESGLVRAICAALGKATMTKAKKATDGRADLTFLGFEILHRILGDVDSEGRTQQTLQSPRAITLLDAVASEPDFIQAMCSTLLLKTAMKLPRYDDEDNHGLTLDVPKLYGSPFILVQEKCAFYKDTHEASAAFLFAVSVFACAIESQGSDDFWNTVMLQDLPVKTDADERLQACATLSAHFLALTTVEYGAFVPIDHYKKQDYINLTRPLVRHRLLEILKGSMEYLSGDTPYGNEGDPYMISLLVSFNVPHLCLSLWKDPALLDLAFDILKQIVEQVPNEVLHLFVEGKPALTSLFDLLNINSAVETSKNIGEIRQFLAYILGQLVEKGLLNEAVERFDVRSSAISALASACLSEHERPVDEEENIMSNRLSTVLMHCLVDLCSVSDKAMKEGKRIQLSPNEASAIAKNLGRKICQMVLARFLERARLQQYEMDDDDEIMNAPDVAMLCAVAQHDEALQFLRSIGGLHALSLVAAEGETLAMMALRRACRDNAEILLEGDCFKGLMSLLASNTGASTFRDHVRHGLETGAFELLFRLCESAKGRKAVTEAEHCEACLKRAIQIIAVLAGIPDEVDDNGPDPASSNLGNESDSNDDDSEKSTEENAVSENGQAENTSSKLAIISSRDAGMQVGVGACLFLSSLASTTVGKAALLESSIISTALSTLSSGDSEAPLELRFASLKLISSLATYSSDSGRLSTDGVAEVIIAALMSKEKVKATGSLNKNLMLDCAVTGLSVIFDFLDADKQRAALLVVKKLFFKCVKSCVITRSTVKENENAAGAELCYRLTIILLMARGNANATQIFSHDLLSAFVNLVQWRWDPKTSLENTNAKAWDAAIANCLILLSFLIWRPEEATSDLDLGALTETILMLARPGKAPRQAIDFKSALKRIMEGTDASASLAAKRILDRIF